MRLTIILISFLFCAVSCEEAEFSGQEIQEQMSAVNEEIETLISLNCGESTTCKTLPVGAKACGGPTHYVVFSSVTDEVALQALIDEYTSLNEKYNQATNAISDCSLVNPPEVACVEGVCQTVD